MPLSKSSARSLRGGPAFSGQPAKAAFKKRVVLEALRGDPTVQELVVCHLKI